MGLVKKTMLFLSLLSVSILATPVGDYGQLSVNQTSKKLVNSSGNNVILRGMSLFWNNYDKTDNVGYWNADVVTNMAKNWDMNVVRAAMGAGDKSQYFYDGINSSDITDVETIVDAAIAAGIYVIIDWHGHYASDHLEDAKAFFSKMAQKYGSYPNVMYEIWNEPTVNDGAWSSTIKPYAEAVIAEIRKYDSDNIVIVGTGNYCQRLDQVVNNEINDPNVMYAVHIYANTHWNTSVSGSDWTREKIRAGLGFIPVFMTEWGTCTADGAGSVSTTLSDQVLNEIEGFGISWCNWSINKKDEAASAIKSSVSIKDGSWTASDLTESGAYIFNKMKDLNPDYSANSNGASPIITASDIMINVNETYAINATATDAEDGDLTNSISVDKTIDTSVGGKYAVTLSVTDSDGNTTTKIIYVTVDDGSTPTDYVLIDDFENAMNDKDNQTYLGARFNYYISKTDNYDSAGYWWAYDDAKDNGNSFATPNYVVDKDFENGLQTTGAYEGGQCLRTQITLGSGYAYAYYGIGFNLTEEGVYSNLSNMSKITFYAKGSGKMKIAVQTKEAIVDFASDWGQYEKEFTLTSNWTEYTVLASDLVASKDSELKTYGAGFATSSVAVCKMQFQTVGSPGDEIDFYVDKIALHGVNYSDFTWGSHVDNGGVIPDMGKPTVQNIHTSTVEDASAAITLLGSDENGTIAKYEIATQPQNGTVVITNAVATYVPNNGYYGEDSFTYYAIDNDGLQSEPATVTVTVEAFTSILDFIDEDQFNCDDLVVGPMPLTSYSKVFYTVKKDGSYTLELYTTSEYLVGKTVVNAKAGENDFVWDIVTKLPRGVYYIALKDGKERVALTQIIKAN